MSDSLNLFLIDSLLHCCCFLEGEQCSDVKIYNTGEIRQCLLLEAAKRTHNVYSGITFRKRFRNVKETQICNEYVDFIPFTGSEGIPLLLYFGNLIFSDFQSLYRNWEQITFFLLCSESSKAPGAVDVFCMLSMRTRWLHAQTWAQQLSYSAPWALLLVKMLLACVALFNVWHLLAALL